MKDRAGLGELKLACVCASVCVCICMKLMYMYLYKYVCLFAHAECDVCSSQRIHESCARVCTHGCRGWRSIYRRPKLVYESAIALETSSASSIASTGQPCDS